MADYRLTDADRETLKAFRHGMGIFVLIPANPFRVEQPNPLFRPRPLKQGIPFSIAESYYFSLDPDLTEEERFECLAAWARRIGGANE